MKSLLKCSFTMAALVIMIGVASNSAMATPVTYTTTGVFTGPGGAANVLTIGTTTLVYTGTTETANPMPGGFAFTQLGSFAFSAQGIGTVGPGVMFTLTITQLAPPGGPGSISATVTGAVSFDGSTVFVNFGNPNSGQLGPNTLTIGAFTYTPYNVSINNFPLTTTLQGRVDERPIPEPTSMLLLGTGLAGAAGIVRRRTRARGLKS